MSYILMFWSSFIPEIFSILFNSWLWVILNSRNEKSAMSPDYRERSWNSTEKFKKKRQIREDGSIQLGYSSGRKLLNFESKYNWMIDEKHNDIFDFIDSFELYLIIFKRYESKELKLIIHFVTRRGLLFCLVILNFSSLCLKFSNWK